MAPGGRSRRSRRPKSRPKPEKTQVDWDPKTKLGRLVRSGTITNMSDALRTGLPIREPEIVDVLLPEIDDEVIDVNMVQRMTDSGRRVKFVITVAVGNKDGFIGFGQAKGKEVGSSIRKAIENAKLNIIEIRRGCGSWECGCKKPHTVPYAINGKSGSVEITLKPAPQGIGLATGNVAKKILTLAGVKDCWAFTRGKTKTTVNYAKAVFNALEENTEMRILDEEIRKVGIVTGSIGLPEEKQQHTTATEPTTTPATSKQTEKTNEQKPNEENKPEAEKPNDSKPTEHEEKKTDEPPKEEAK